jgi:lysophospholipase L1-like esterase
VLTDSSSMWTVPRLPHPLRYVAGLRSKQFNRAYGAIAIKQGITYAPTAQITAHDFVHNRRNFAADLFHPSTQGYTLLAKALQPYLDKALAKQASHCK